MVETKNKQKRNVMWCR